MSAPSSSLCCLVDEISGLPRIPGDVLFMTRSPEPNPSHRIHQIVSSARTAALHRIGCQRQDHACFKPACAILLPPSPLEGSSSSPELAPRTPSRARGAHAAHLCDQCLQLDRKSNCLSFIRHGSGAWLTLLKSIFAPAFPCLTSLLRAPLLEGLAMVFLVSQRWLDAAVVLIALLLSIVLVDRFVNLLPARWPLWRSKADLPMDMFLFMKRPGIIVPVSELALRTLFPPVAERDALRRRSLMVSKTITGLVPAGDGSLDVDQLCVCWDDVAVSHAPSCSSTLLTMPSRTAVGAGSYCTATMTGTLG